jgi:DNA-binding MarR family transcriptional regulator
VALRTHQVFAAVAHAQRLHVLLAILRNDDLELRRRGRTQAQALAELLGMKQPAVSLACRELLAAGLLERPGNTREAFRVARPRETRALIRAAALIESSAFDATEAAALAKEMLHQDMARGATDQQGVEYSRTSGDAPTRNRT